MNKTTFDFQGDQMGWIYNSLLKSVEKEEKEEKEEIKAILKNNGKLN